MPRFEWDEVKAQSNFKKHGIGFEEASLVFENPLAVIFSDMEHSDFEAREILLGHTKNGILLPGQPQNPNFVHFVGIPNFWRAQQAAPLRKNDVW
jgi:hypothetical protein